MTHGSRKGPDQGFLGAVAQMVNSVEAKRNNSHDGSMGRLVYIYCQNTRVAHTGFRL